MRAQVSGLISSALSLRIDAIERASDCRVGEINAAQAVAMWGEALADLPEAHAYGAHDFDFLFGRWIVSNERLKTRLKGADDWEQFGAACTCWPILGGIGNVDDFRPEWPGLDGFRGASLRLFDPSTRMWSIYWADNVRFTLFPPVAGSFRDGVGEFFGEDVEGETPVQVRYLWSEITATTARWEQAFSRDDGKTWESNWVMKFSRSTDEARRAQEGVSR